MVVKRRYELDNMLYVLPISFEVLEQYNDTTE